MTDNTAGTPEKKKLTKEEIEKMIESLRKMEGKEISPGRPINLNPDTASWYIAYGTAKNFTTRTE